MRQPPRAPLIAIAAGSYVEEVRIQGKPLRLWGKCPAEVELVGTGASIATVIIGGSASGSELAGLAIRGPTIGVVATGSESLQMHGLWVPDNPSRGIDIEDTLGPTSATISSSLIEHNGVTGVLVIGSVVEIDAVEVRDTSSQDSGDGFGVSIQDDEDGPRSSALVRASLIEQNHEIGVFVLGSDAELEGLVVRDTLPRESDQTHGIGVGIQRHGTTGASSKAVLGASLIEGNHEYGLAVVNSEAQLLGVSVLATMGRASDDLFGDGVVVPREYMDTRVELSSCRIDDNARAGLSVFGATASIRASSLSCNMLQLVAETYRDRNAELTDEGFNRCSCGDEEPPCVVLSVGLAPPEIVDPVE